MPRNWLRASTTSYFFSPSCWSHLVLSSADVVPVNAFLLPYVPLCHVPSIEYKSKLYRYITSL